MRLRHWKQCSSTAQSRPCGQHWKPVSKMTSITSLNRTERQTPRLAKAWGDHSVVSSSVVAFLWLPWHVILTSRIQRSQLHFHCEVKAILITLHSTKYPSRFPWSLHAAGYRSQDSPLWEGPQGQHVLCCLTKPFCLSFCLPCGLPLPVGYYEVNSRYVLSLSIYLYISGSQPS